MENYKNNFGYFTPSYYSTPRNIPAFQGWIEPLNLPAKRIDESEKNPNEISTHVSEDLEDKTSINGKKSTKKRTRESWNYLQTTELVSLWKENLSILESSRCNKSWHFIQKEVPKLGHEKTKLQCKNKIRNLKDLYKNAKLNNSKSGAAPRMSPFFDVFDEVLSSRDVVNISEKKEVGFARQTSGQETISLDGGSSSLTNSTDSSRSSDGKMYSFYKKQEILIRDQVKPSLKKKRLLKFHSITIQRL